MKFVAEHRPNRMSDFVMGQRSRIVLWVSLAVVSGALQAAPGPGTPARLNRAAIQYLGMLENFAGFVEEHWNAREQSYDAAGRGVTWARGNGGVCLLNAVLLVEYPEKDNFSTRKISRQTLFEHTRQALRTVCLRSSVCE